MILALRGVPPRLAAAVRGIRARAALLRRLLTSTSVHARAAVAALIALPSAALSHTVLDPELAQALLNEIAQYQTAAHSEKAREIRAEALFVLAGKAQTLTGLLNQDVDAHGTPNRLTMQVAQQLSDSGIKVTWSEQRRRYAYDMEALRQYSAIAPNGTHAPEARFRIISGGFYATLDMDPSKVAARDLPAVMAAAADEERFLRDFPDDPRAKEVRFYLGVDCYRLALNVVDRDQAVGYRRCARQVLETVAARYPGSIEARAASSLLESTDAAKR